MTKGVLLFCFDTAEVKYHKILERCVGLIKKNLKSEITVVTDFNTFSKLKPLGFINYKFIRAIPTSLFAYNIFQDSPDLPGIFFTVVF